MLGNPWVAAQLATSQGLSSMELVHSYGFQGNETKLKKRDVMSIFLNMYIQHSKLVFENTVELPNNQ
jgi:hypothetical protein